MRKINIKIFLIVVALIATMQNCKFNESINTDPNNPKTSPVSALLTPAEMILAYTWGGNISRYNCMLTQQLEGVDRQAAGIYLYTFISSDTDDPWDNLYRGMQNLKLIIDQSGTKSPYYSGIAKILMANSLGMVAAHFGDAPYSDAFKAYPDLANLQPKYDSQEQLYIQIQALLDQGIADLGASSSLLIPAGDDIIYGGDLASWTATAHALKARYYLHLGKVNSANYSNAFDESVMALAGFSQYKITFAGASATSQNPWFQWTDQRDDIRPNQVMVDTLLSYSDERLGFYADTAEGGLGLTYDYLMSPNSPVYLLSTSELNFIKSEAAFKIGNLDSAAAAYNAGVAASFEEVGATNSYSAEDTLTISLNKIMTQKWLALFLNPETWTDWRRTGIPVLSPVAGNTSNDVMPRKYPYPSKEQSLNGANVPFQETPPFKTRVWWDQ